MIDNEQVLRRYRKSIPDGYFDEFSVLTDVLDRQRRGQPISDYTDEFSADPFEVSVNFEHRSVRIHLHKMVSPVHVGNRQKS